MGFYGGEKSERNLELMFFKSKSSFPWQESTVRCRVHKKKKKRGKNFDVEIFWERKQGEFFLFFNSEILVLSKRISLARKILKAS